jgi:hypothetical protein
MSLAGPGLRKNAKNVTRFRAKTTAKSVTIYVYGRVVEN